MNRADSNTVTFSFSPHWLFMPPIVAIFTFAVALYFSMDANIQVDSAVWGLVWLMFIILTVLYGIFLRWDFIRGLLPVQLIAQGILLCPLSLQMGAMMLSWVGVLLAICGAVVLLAMYYHSRAERAATTDARPAELDNLPVPFAITDADGYIISASDFLLQLAQKPRSVINGEKIDSLFSLDEETTNMGGKEWKIQQTLMDDGTHYFHLEEARDATVVTVPAGTEFENFFVDSATSLYNRSYAIKRVEEELYRIYRYKRWMSAALLHVTFQEGGASSGLDPKKEDDIFNAYCRFVNSSTRETDILCLAGPREILVVMPETQSDGAQDVVSKLLDFKAYIQEKIQGSDDAMKVIERTLFFNASSGVLDFDRLMEKLDEAMKN